MVRRFIPTFGHEFHTLPNRRDPALFFFFLLNLREEEEREGRRAGPRRRATVPRLKRTIESRSHDFNGGIAEIVESIPVRKSLIRQGKSQ